MKTSLSWKVLTRGEWELENEELLLGFDEAMRLQLYEDWLMELFGLNTTGETRCLN